MAELWSVLSLSYDSHLGFLIWTHHLTRSLLRYHHTKFNLNKSWYGLRYCSFKLSLVAILNFNLAFRICQSLLLATTIPVFSFVCLKIAELYSYLKLTFVVSLNLAFTVCWVSSQQALHYISALHVSKLLSYVSGYHDECCTKRPFCPIRVETASANQRSRLWHCDQHDHKPLVLCDDDLFICLICFITYS